MSEKFYITTPIYYPSAKLHIGHAYCTTATDTIARYKRLMGYDVMFLTGSDEHGQKIEKIAQEKGVTPQQYVDEIVASIQDLWKKLNISNDDFIRTTQDRHIKSCQKIFEQLYKQGDIYKSEYEGWYCTPCESFWTETQLVDGKCPDCGREVVKTKEESYFFKASRYADRLIKYIEEHPDFIQPESRKNEMLKNFLLPGLEDLCVSRTSFKWGIPVTFDPGHIMYVWVDALSNYISALGYGSDDENKFNKYWPADLHVVGKEIVRFHTIVWPCMLMALGLPLPKQVFGHGWLVVDGDKMSKSKGNVVDPVFLIDRYGADSIRYYLMREVPFGSDGMFANEGLVYRINADLANDLGNLLSRTVTMIEKYFDSEIAGDLYPVESEDAEVKELGLNLRNVVEKYVNELRISDALSAVWKYIGILNKYIDITMPWTLAKDDAKKDRLASVMYNLAEGLRIIAILVSPVMPETAEKMYDQLGVDVNDATWENAGKYGWFSSSAKVKRGEVLFPRINVEEEMAFLLNNSPSKAAKKPDYKPEITFDDFSKVDLRTAVVVAAENLAGSDKLLKLTVDCGGESRTIVSGIRESYTAEEMVGKTVIIVANLKPAKLRGTLSEGMILACGEKDDICIVSPEKKTESGKSVH